MSAVGVVIAVSAFANAAASPSLPARSAAQLLAEVAQANGKPLGPFTATIQQTANLGLPDLPAALQPTGTPGLLGGTQSVTIWYANPQHIRVALPVQAGESDLRLDGRTLWLWNSKTQTVTKVELPAHVAGPPGGLAPPVPGANGQSLPSSPQAAAKQILAAIGPSTAVAVQRNVYVAGRAAYVLSLVPRTSASLIGKVLIAIDASRHIPLQVQVFARATSDLAYGIGFSSLTFGEPAASNFSFMPPAGATVKTQALPSNPVAFGKGILGPAALGLGSTGLSPFGTGGIQVSGPHKVVLRKGNGSPVAAGPPLPKQVLAALKAEFAKTLPKDLSKAERAKAISAFDRSLAASATGTPKNGGGFIHFQSEQSISVRAGAAKVTGAPKVIGKDWLSVIATPPNPAVAAAVKQQLSAAAAGASIVQTNNGMFGSSSQSAATTGPGSGQPAGPDLAVLQAVLRATTAVHGRWGSGRLLQTTLLSVLVTSKGQILAGAVSPAVLYADVASDAG